MKVPLCRPDVGLEEERAVCEVLRSGHLAHGSKGKEFEEQFASYIGTKYAVSLNSCASALEAAIEASMGFGEDGEIILPSFTFVASLNAVVNACWIPVFADIDYDTCNIDPQSIERMITKKTIGIMPVHYGGQSADMEKILEIADAHDLFVIEDSAETIGGLFKGKKTGAFGIGCFSFYPTKNMTSGEGGMVTTDDARLAEKIRAIRGHGITPSAYQEEKKEKPWFRSADSQGYNFRMSDLNAAVGLEQLKKVDAMNEKRREHAAYLSRELRKIQGIEVPVTHPDAKHVYQMYTVKVGSSIDRDMFVKELNKMGVGASVHFEPAVHQQDVGRFYHHDDLKVTEDVSRRIATLPMYPSLTQEELDYVLDSVEKAVKVAKR